MRRALAFLTVLGRGAVPDARTFRWFPAAGLAIGAGVGAVWWGAAEVWPAAVAAAVVVAADLSLTGALHLDGLVDSADGLLPHLARDRRLAVMAEPGVGAFGTSAAVVALVLRVTALASMRPSVLLVAGLWCQARTTMALAGSVVPAARPGSMIASFASDDRRAEGADRLLLSGGLAVSLAVTALGTRAGAGVAAGVVAWATAAIGAAAVVGLARRRLGGVTGDVLGAAGVVGETVGLVVAAGRW